MSWSYDSETQALYIGLSSEEIEGQVEMPDGVVVDVDAAGAAVGIEVVRAQADWDLPAVVEQFGLSEDQALYAKEIAYTAARYATGSQRHLIGVGEDVDVRANGLLLPA